MLISASDSLQFHKLYPLLLRYAAIKIEELKDRKAIVRSLSTELTASDAIELRDFLFFNPIIIDQFISENPHKLDKLDLQRVGEWRNFKAGKFIIERELKNYTVFLATSEKCEAFGVLGLTSEIHEMLRHANLPVMVDTVLLQWKECIIHDGLFSTYSISFGSGIRKTFKDQYMIAKSNGIVTSFLNESKKSKNLTINAPANKVIPLKNVAKPQVKLMVELKIVLNKVNPLVWRKITLNPNITLYDLHFVIQKAMGWHDCHLHNFSLGRNSRCFAPPESDDFGFDDDLEEDSRKVTLLNLINEGHSKMTYNYDFGDDWEHKLIFKFKEVKTGPEKYPLCTGGAGACPPEDSGGAWGYMRLCEVLANPKDSEYKAMKKWVAKGFNPLDFSIDLVNDRLSSK